MKFTLAVALLLAASTEVMSVSMTATKGKVGRCRVGKKKEEAKKREEIEKELADAIDQEIALAVEMGIDEAAVTAGWEAYFEVLAQGGTYEEANAAAYEACGSACDNY